MTANDISYANQVWEKNKIAHSAASARLDTLTANKIEKHTAGSGGGGRGEGE